MSIHVAITRRVRPGKEAEFEERLNRFAQRSLAVEGTRGVQMLHPAPGSDNPEYGIMRTFASPQDRDAFYTSDLYLDWEKEIAHLADGTPKFRDLHGLEAWFRQPDVPRPPRWKMALATWIGVYPTSLMLGLLLAPHLHAMPKPLSALIISGCMVVCLTWLVMPTVTKLMHAWLHPRA
ncbi:hypothetical protein EI77_02313 [Prosthecobacter fusiformis]|uniref:ABM domain-containing protein n=1 Tax=Prosthecobacter fusiformis TaxID=48464 RepID=A0A4R7RZ97_9BACT|nr:antibiotic biosynthesis monooxygenase [Prosthecobacter fusiformis]TDU71191.1 hypothetical protein EI77_02313 [Prosthecobacter fusiformis]